MNTTPISTCNRYAIPSEDANDEATVMQSNKSTKHNNPQKQHKRNSPTHTSYTTAQLKITKDMAVADAGVTGHFFLPGTPVTNIKISRHPLKINLPDGDCLTSTHTYTLDIPWLPKEAKEAHIVPDLDTHS